jgi:hypothetical protein
MRLFELARYRQCLWGLVNRLIMYLRVPLKMDHPGMVSFWTSTCITNLGNHRIGNLFLEILWVYWFVKFSSNHLFSDPLVLYLLITASPPLDPIRSQCNHNYSFFIILIFQSTCMTHLNIRNVAIRPGVIVYLSPFHGCTIGLTRYSFRPEFDVCRAVHRNVFL